MANKRQPPVMALRQRLGLTQEAFAAELGLKSKGQVSEIERGNRCSPEIALAIERLSDGGIDAGSLNPVVAAARQSRPSEVAA